MKKILISLLFPLALFAEEQTTGNLITNSTFNNGTTGWTLSGDAQRISDCCPGGHDLEFGDSGNIEQSFNLSSEFQFLTLHIKVDNSYANSIPLPLLHIN